MQTGILLWLIILSAFAIGGGIAAIIILRV